MRTGQGELANRRHLSPWTEETEQALPGVNPQSGEFHEAYFGFAICKALRAECGRKISRPIFTVCAGIHRFQ